MKLFTFEITVIPHPRDLNSWSWSLSEAAPVRNSETVRSGNSYASADDAKRAAEECADTIAAAAALTKTYTYTPKAVK